MVCGLGFLIPRQKRLFHDSQRADACNLAAAHFEGLEKEHQRCMRDSVRQRNLCSPQSVAVSGSVHLSTGRDKALAVPHCP